MEYDYVYAHVYIYIHITFMFFYINCVYFMQISKAKVISESLIASEGTDLKFEEAFCLFLLGQVHFTFI